MKALITRVIYIMDLYYPRAYTLEVKYDDVFSEQ